MDYRDIPFIVATKVVICKVYMGFKYLRDSFFEGFGVLVGGEMWISCAIREMPPYCKVGKNILEML